jgi:ABC-type nickel/cobalt efflux system permease component RcnA
MSDLLTVVTVVVVVAIVLVAVVAVWMVVRRRSLRQRFGPEYDRVVSEQDGRFAAERELRARERRHAELDLQPLSEESRDAYARSWEEIQARFVDAPNEAVGAADELVTRLIAERGYPTEDFDEQIAQLSVEHARTLEHYRDAHEIHLRNERGEAGTEQLRQALVHYRALFGDLLGQPQNSRSDPAATVPPATVPRTRERSSDAHPERAS